jgi:uncharacterized heparinase superfamily protein
MNMMRAVRLSDYLGASVSAARREASATLNSINPFHFQPSIGSTADVLVVTPEDYFSTNSERGESILAGRFQLAGETIDIALASDIWTQTTPSRAFARRLHSFAWLRDCAAAGGGSASGTACDLTDGWITSFGRWNSFAWNHDVLATRVMNWLRCGSTLFDAETQSDESRSKRLQSLLGQLRYLQRSLSISQEGSVRLRGAAALSLGGLSLHKQGELLKSGLAALEVEIARQILPDGGHVSRSPRAGAEALIDLITVQKAADERGVEFPDSLLRAISRLAPMVRFFEATDGSLFSFHGGGEYDRQALSKALDIHGTTTRAFGFAPHTGYHRAHAGDATVVLDAGEAARGPLSTGAHASALAFEMSTSGGRLIVNCGWHDDQPPNWREAVRATAAHSTLTLEETSSARLLAPGWKRDLLGPRLESTPGPVTARRNEEDMGVWIEATHEGYREVFGLSHRRRIFLAADGGDLRGEDALYRPVSDGAPDDVDIRWRFAIRFHLHPDVRASLARDAMSALLVQPGGDGWRFRTDGGPVRLERSVYLAAGAPPQRATQIVVYGDAEPYGAGDKPPNRVRWAFQRLGRIGGAGGEKE